MNAKDILKQVESEIFNLRNLGEIEIYFGEYINDFFNVYLSDINEIEVEYSGKHIKVTLPSSVNDMKDNLLSRYIMQGFSKLYLNINESKNMKKKLVKLTESDLHRIIKESVKNVLKESDYDYRKGKWNGYELTSAIYDAYEYLNNKFGNVLFRAMENEFKDDELVNLIAERYEEFKKSLIYYMKDGDKTLYDDMEQ